MDLLDHSGHPAPAPTPRVTRMDFQDALPYHNKLVEEIRDAAARLLAEDVGPGDITAQLIPAEQFARARVITRDDCVLCGVAWSMNCSAASMPR